jgi:NADPH2:quinone reductase
VTNNQGVDVIIEMLADVNLDKDLKMLAIDGRVVIVGCRGKIEIEPRYVLKTNNISLSFIRLFSFSLSLFASHFIFSIHSLLFILFSDTMTRRSSILGMSLPRATESEKEDIRRALYAGLENHILRPVIGQVFSLSQVLTHSNVPVECP